MTASPTFAQVPQSDSEEARPAHQRDLASTGALHRVMGRIDFYLHCMSNPQANDGLRHMARQQVEAALALELNNARVLSR